MTEMMIQMSTYAPPSAQLALHTSALRLGMSMDLIMLLVRHTGKTDDATQIAERIQSHGGLVHSMGLRQVVALWPVLSATPAGDAGDTPPAQPPRKQDSRQACRRACEAALELHCSLQLVTNCAIVRCSPAPVPMSLVCTAGRGGLGTHEHLAQVYQNLPRFFQARLCL